MINYVYYNASWGPVNPQEALFVIPGNAILGGYKKPKRLF